VNALRNVTTGDDYTAATTLEARDTVRLVITTSGATLIDYQLAHGWPPQWDSPESSLAPGFVFTLERRCSAVRFKSHAPGVPAQVTAEAVQEHDVPE
jgi:hypothetical protein